MCGQPGELVRVEPGAAGLEGRVARDDVDQRCLASPVGSDQAMDRTFLYLQRPPVDGVNPAEVPLDVIQAKEHGHSGAATTRA